GAVALGLFVAYAAMFGYDKLREALEQIINWEKIPTNILAFLVAMAVTLLAFFAACQIMAWAVTWYMVAGAVALGLFVAYAAMFGYDKLREALEQIINWEKIKTE
uniref:hypothetical protein n=1 Tax=Dysosmobacter welbionis TaxID=2093857 RepID=UPI003A915E78